MKTDNEDYYKILLSTEDKNILNLDSLNIIFGNDYLNYIIENNLINVLISLEKYEILNLKKECYCLCYFKTCNLTKCLSLHNAKGINFFNKLIRIINGEEENYFKSEIIHKIGDNRYIIIIPDEFYYEINVNSIKKLFSYLIEGDFKEIFKDEVAKYRKNIISLIDCLGGINENIFLTYNYYVNRIVDEVNLND